MYIYVLTYINLVYILYKSLLRWLILVN